MKNSILSITNLLCWILLLTASTSCSSYSGEKWLTSIFQCQDGNGYCLPELKDIFTEQYQEFYSESIGIYEYPEFETDDEQMVAENAFKKKWKDIYPLGKYIWPHFGSGNGMEAGDRLENVTISRISDLKYSVLIEYRDGMVFSNELTLIQSGDKFLIDYIATEFEEQKAILLDISNPGADKLLPIFMANEANTILYEKASKDSEIAFTLNAQDNTALIALTAMKDVENRVWYKCYCPKFREVGWTRQVSHWDFSEDEKHLPFLQNLTLATLQLGANHRDALGQLGKPKTENSETGPMEVSGFVDEDNIVTTTTMEYDSIELIYEEDRMIHAIITKPGKSFGWITCADKACNKDFLIKKFNLTQDDFSKNEEGDVIVHLAMEVLLVTVTFDKNELVKKIVYNLGS